jgi:hypothetical protein
MYEYDWDAYIRHKNKIVFFIIVPFFLCPSYLGGGKYYKYFHPQHNARFSRRKKGRFFCVFLQKK